jgi:acetyltransferase
LDCRHQVQYVLAARALTSKVTTMKTGNDASRPSTVVAYPAAWERNAQTLDGVPFRIRPIKIDDEDLERRFIVGLSPESRYRRMMCAMREPSPQLLYQFVHVDYKDDMAFVALAGGPADEHIIGVARYARDAYGPDSEFAVAVSDEWQGRGVGATLTRLLFEYAREQGIQRLYGEILANNERMIELVHWMGMDTRMCPDDAALVEASLTP